MDCIEQAGKIYETCVPCAKAGNTITYRGVLDALGYRHDVGGISIRYGLELAWIACLESKLPPITAIIVNKSTGMPTEEGYPLDKWEDEVKAVFAYRAWPAVDDIDWNYMWHNRRTLSDKHGTRGYWNR